MEKELKQIQLWKELYKNENLQLSVLNSDVKNLVEMKGFFNPPKASILGIEFLSHSLYGYNNLNYYTIVYLTKAFYELFLIEKTSANVALYFDSNIEQNIRSRVISYLTAKKCNVFVFDNQEITPNMIHTLNFSNIDMSFLIFHHSNQAQKDYVSIYHNNLVLTIKEQQKLIDHFCNDVEFINFGFDDIPVYINLEKLLLLNQSKKFSIQISSFFQREQFKSVVLVENRSESKFIKTLLRDSKIKFKISSNSYLFSYYNSTTRSIFKRFFIFDNFLSYEGIFLISRNNQLKVFIKQKNKFILLNQYQIAYLFIRNEVLNWRKQLYKKILVPDDCPQILIELIRSFNFVPLETSSYTSDRDLIFGFINDTYLCEYNNQFRFSNISMMLLLLEIFARYKQNNNLLNLKLFKMKEHFAKNFFITKKIKVNLEQVQLIQSNLFLPNQAINKKYQIEHIQKINYQFQNEQFLLIISSSHNQRNSQTLVRWIVSYNHLTSLLKINTEFNLDNSIGWFTKCKLKRINRKFLKKIKAIL
ncbi:MULTISPECIES: MAG5620 family putative phospho-sugar mutase [unclassified Mycoplasma]|uniref:MAG5620 family putative phospho-sugar mutase n=1 Tax=unclassified Mycoplasma TaxID=2683645 RepID=UPI00211C20E3|nr:MULTISPECIES: hypothetical protein [unclassified Mycoplasma]UUM20074.1 hypothetical protein NPA11_01450 [Mycoplasma sp. 1578d]UUM25054.1 hypothetical protein NPA12_01425 [Mycoplasma sp. 3686d]